MLFICAQCFYSSPIASVSHLPAEPRLFSVCQVEVSGKQGEGRRAGLCDKRCPAGSCGPKGVWVPCSTALPAWVWLQGKCQKVWPINSPRTNKVEENCGLLDPWLSNSCLEKWLTSQEKERWLLSQSKLKKKLIPSVACGYLVLPFTGADWEVSLACVCRPTHHFAQIYFQGMCVEFHRERSARKAALFETIPPISVPPLKYSALTSETWHNWRSWLYFEEKAALGSRWDPVCVSWQWGAAEEGRAEGANLSLAVKAKVDPSESMQPACGAETPQRWGARVSQFREDLNMECSCPEPQSWQLPSAEIPWADHP